jgi:thiol-disulfide isomerase/thioredoxin
MRVVKIGAVWCNGCLVMNNVWNKVLKTKDVDTKVLDIDMDEEEVKDYNVGDVLPVFIFYIGDKEVKRIVGEVSYDEMIKVIEEIENEEN